MLFLSATKLSNLKGFSIECRKKSGNYCGFGLDLTMLYDLLSSLGFGFTTLNCILFVLETSFSSSGDVLFFHDMAGVFYAVVFGLVVSLFTLLCELAWAARKDKKHNQVEHLFIYLLLTYLFILYKVTRMSVLDLLPYNLLL